MKNRQALLVGDLGDHFLIALEIAPLLKRAGFDVDLVTNNPISKKLKSIGNCIYLDDADDIPRVALARTERVAYDLIVVLDDFSLMKIKNSDLSNNEKLVLLPVEKQQNFEHIGSKIGLSLVLRQHGIKTPDFSIAKNKMELEKSIDALGYPVLIKIDFSGAGHGTFECRTKHELESIIDRIKIWPVLLQRKIKGTDIDLSAFYRNSELINFIYATVEAWEFNRFGPSSVRTYTQLGKLESDIFSDLRRLGRALGANGFVNIGCVQSDVDHQRYFIEADMRPNVWVNYPKYFGDDPAIPISKYFSDGEVIKYPYAVHSEFPDQIILPYFSRIKLWELAVNKYKSWSYLPDENPFVILFALVDKEMKNLTRRVIKPMVPAGLWLRLKRAYDTAIRKLIR